MKRYGQFCPIAKAAEIFCERWTALVIRNIAVGAHRFSDIRRGVPLMSATLLSQRLKMLEAERIVERVRADGAGHWSYRLTRKGEDFVPLVEALGEWGQRWSRRALEPGEIDFGLLIWGLEFSVNPGAFGSRPVTVRIEFQDQPEDKRFAWFVNDGEEVELCLTDPGHEVDLWLSATLRDITYLYNGDLKLGAAIESGRLDVLGAKDLVRRLENWFNFSPLTEVRAEEDAVEPTP